VAIERIVGAGQAPGGALVRAAWHGAVLAESGDTLDLQLGHHAYLDGERVLPLPRMLDVDEYFDYVTNRAVADLSEDLKRALEGLLPCAEARFDAVTCECAFCTFPDKRAVAAELARVLRPGGALGLADLVRRAPLPLGLADLLAWIACIADARPPDECAGHLTAAGFEVTTLEDHGRIWSGASGSGSWPPRWPRKQQAWRFPARTWRGRASWLASRRERLPTARSTMC
jgi:SAM-dependent methyltransferase